MVEPYRYLYNIDSPNDLRSLSIDELPSYCDELRKFIIEQVSTNPGHLGSSLGVVELAVAIHYVYDTPYDKLIWDVGHQAYAHKIITGRRDTFHTNRKYGGISGFPNIKESDYDSFGVGHSSTSISVAVGMDLASKIQKINRNVVAVIGDGSMSCGLAFEGLNNSSNTDILVILNDNRISIDPNVGALKEYLLKISTSRHYNKIKSIVWKVLHRTPRLQRLLQKAADSTKAFFLNQGNLFEALGFRYFGPIDGNDVVSLVKRLEDLKNIKGARLLHILTLKGKGYKPAEQNQTEWHAPGLFYAETGERQKTIKKELKYQDIFGYTLLEIAKINDRVVGITPAMPTGCSLNILMNTLPERAFDVGIAEGHAVTFAAAMAKEGLVPFCNIYSSFVQRAIDNIIHDVALQELEVILCLDRAGLVGEDGATHHGVFDIPLLRSVPNIIITAPSNAEELRNLMYTASIGGYKAAFVIRYPRGGSFSEKELKKPLNKIEIGKARVIINGTSKVSILSFGNMLNSVVDACARLKKNDNISPTIVDMRFIKPLDIVLLDRVARDNTLILTIEDGVISGGAGSSVIEYYAKKQINVRVIQMGIDDEFVEHGTINELRQFLNIDSDAIYDTIIKQVNQG